MTEQSLFKRNGIVPTLPRHSFSEQRLLWHGQTKELGQRLGNLSHPAEIDTDSITISSTKPAIRC